MILNRLPKKQLLLFLSDALVIFFSATIAYGLRQGWPPDAIEMSWQTGVILLIYLSAFYFSDLYDIEAGFNNLDFLLKSAISLSVALGFSAAAYFLVPALKTGRMEFVLTAALVWTVTSTLRLLLDYWLKRYPGRRKRLLIVGAGRAGMQFYEAAKDGFDYETIGFIDDDMNKWGTHNSPKVLGGCATLNEMSAGGAMDAIVIAITNAKSAELLRCAVECKMKGIQVHEMPSLYEELTGKVPVEHINDLWFVLTPIIGTRRNMYNMRIKRALDLLILVALFPISALLATITAIAVRIDSPGSVLYRQKRTGLNGRTFELIKFRSMRIDAEKGGAVWAKKEDPRVTRVGSVIRKIRMDEIPQMWNVLKGDMSFIGPRPERPEFVEKLSRKIPYYSLRHSIKPGLTGWAQINYPYGASEKDALEKLRYDFFYLKNVNLFLDLIIVLKTVKVVLFAKGAR